jgi:hypothetical protein
MRTAHGANDFAYRGFGVSGDRNKKGRTPQKARPEIYKAPYTHERNLDNDCTAD